MIWKRCDSLIFPASPSWFFPGANAPSMLRLHHLSAAVTPSNAVSLVAYPLFWYPTLLIHHDLRLRRFSSSWPMSKKLVSSEPIATSSSSLIFCSSRIIATLVPKIIMIRFDCSRNSGICRRAVPIFSVDKSRTIDLRNRFVSSKSVTNFYLEMKEYRSKKAKSTCDFLRVA